MRSSLAFASSVLDGFLPPGGDPIERVRARFFVAGSGAIASAIAVVLALYASSSDVGLGTALPLAGLLLPVLAFPFLLRRGVSLTLLGAGLIILLQCGLAWSAVLDRGVQDVAFLWFVASPLFAALVGGARLALVSVGSAIVGGVGVLLLAETGYVFPDLMSAEFAQRYHMANVIAAAGVVATFAWLYEGPLLARARALAARLHVVNADLRRELAARRLAQDRAEAASRAKDVLLANLSHEFRTPLTAVISGIEVLEMEAADVDREVLASIDRGARRLLTTLSGVLDLMETESREAPLLEPVDVSPVVREAVAAVRGAAGARGLEVVVNDGGGGVEALASCSALRRLVDLLLDNAVRFTERGAVVVSVGPSPNGIAVAVSDTGIGMDPGFVDRALEPFAQASEGDARTHEGLGLGLTIAHRLAISMGGTLAIESTVGEGTTVRLVLPAVDRPAAPPPPPLPAATVSPSARASRAPTRVPINYAEAMDSWPADPLVSM
ncbi:sensor histidine kinase [Rubrivirga sp. IMCC43871]|uniref:sensor histidine kinase n=1 Tax=Rubrivirga sp. IMCC43871 TaxID=3391575 RepID=UPI00398FD159